jgi:hypothetical protein
VASIIAEVKLLLSVHATSVHIDNI